MYNRELLTAALVSEFGFISGGFIPRKRFFWRGGFFPRFEMNYAVLNNFCWFDLIPVYRTSVRPGAIAVRACQLRKDEKKWEMDGYMKVARYINLLCWHNEISTNRSTTSTIIFWLNAFNRSLPTSRKILRCHGISTSSAIFRMFCRKAKPISIAILIYQLWLFKKCHILGQPLLPPKLVLPFSCDFIIL